MPWLSEIVVADHPLLEDVTISFPSADESSFRHLIVTGPNGSGKTTLLRGLILAASQASSDSIAHRADDYIPNIGWTPSRRSGNAFLASSILVYLPARRVLLGEAPTGPRALELFQTYRSHLERRNNHFYALLGRIDESNLSGLLEQYLVNLKTEQAFAQIEGREGDVARLGQWYETWCERMLALLGIPDGQVVFDSKKYRITFQSADGRVIPFDGLADGHASAIQIVGEILLHVVAVRDAREDQSYQPEGVVIIDELETHLHLELQEKLLPALTAWFPTIQFIVATHSPAVISSIDNAIVFDLGSQRSVLSDDLRGVRYGDLMTSHFDIESDYDLDSTAKVRELDALIGKSSRTPDEEERVRELARFLAERSHVLGLQVWTRLQYRELEQTDARTAEDAES